MTQGERVQRYLVVGNPVEHSQSPFIHTEFASQTGQAMEYGRFLCPLDDFAAVMRRLAEQGLAGCNVTVPFKFSAFEMAPRRTARARLAQAANVLKFDSQGWLADNTDGAGLVNDIERNAGVPLSGRSVLLIGAGGAAAGVLGPLLATGPARMVVANRNPTRAQALVERHRAAGTGISMVAAPLEGCGRDFDVVINATSSSLQGSAIPVGAEVLRRGALVVDMMYGPAANGFLAWASAHGAIGRDGLGMLVEQAAQAFELWRGMRPDTAPVLAALRHRLSSGARSP